MSAPLPRSYPGLTRLPRRGRPPELLDLTPPPELAPEAFAARLYAMLEPLAEEDPSAGWSLLTLVNAIGGMYELVEDWVRDTPAGPGWSLLVDVNRCPPEALPWLAQFVGVRVLPGSSVADQRARIASTDGFRRGTVAALKGAAAATLTGNRSVFLYERDGTPTDKPNYAYHLTVVTYSAQTPDAAATLKAMLAQKPAGLVLVHVVRAGQTYQQVVTRFATYAALKAAYATYAAITADQPAS